MMEDEGIEETDDLREMEYLNDGFDDVDCEVDDLVNSKKGKTKKAMAVIVPNDVDEDMDVEQNDAPLNYSDFFANGNNSSDSPAMMQLKPVSVMSDIDRDRDSEIFPLPQSERKASPQVDEIVRTSRSSSKVNDRSVSPIVKPKISKKVYDSASNKRNRRNPNSANLPRLRQKKSPRKHRLKPPSHLKEKSIASEEEAKREHRLPRIDKFSFLRKRNENDIALAKEKYLKIKENRDAISGEKYEKNHAKKVQEPVSPRINFKYDSRLGLFGFDIEAERQSKRENYELMRIAKKNEEMTEIARARARVAFGAGVMDAKTLVPEDFSFGNPSKPKIKRKKGERPRDAKINKLRSKSEMKAKSRIPQNNIRSVSSEHKPPPKSMKELPTPHDAMQCSPIETQSRSNQNQKNVKVKVNANVVIRKMDSDDVLCQDKVLDDLLHADESDDPRDHQDNSFSEALSRKGRTPPPKVKTKSKKPKSKASASPSKNKSKAPHIIDDSAPSPGKPSTPPKKSKDSFQRKAHIPAETSTSQKKKPPHVPRFKSPRKNSAEEKLEKNSSQPPSPSKTKNKPPPTSSLDEHANKPQEKKKSLAEEIFKDFETFSVQEMSGKEKPLENGSREEATESPKHSPHSSAAVEELEGSKEVFGKDNKVPVIAKSRQSPLNASKQRQLSSSPPAIIANKEIQSKKDVPSNESGAGKQESRDTAGSAGGSIAANSNDAISKASPKKDAGTHNERTKSDFPSTLNQTPAKPSFSEKVLERKESEQSTSSPVKAKASEVASVQSESVVGEEYEDEDFEVDVLFDMSQAKHSTSSVHEPKKSHGDEDYLEESRLVNEALSSSQSKNMSPNRLHDARSGLDKTPTIALEKQQNERSSEQKKEEKLAKALKIAPITDFDASPEKKLNEEKSRENFDSELQRDSNKTTSSDITGDEKEKYDDETGENSGDEPVLFTIDAPNPRHQVKNENAESAMDTVKPDNKQAQISLEESLDEEVDNYNDDFDY